MGVAVIVSVSTFTFSWRSFSFTETPNFCSSSITSSPEVFELHILAQNAVGTDKDIYFTIGKAFDNRLGLRGTAGTAQVFHPARQALQAFLEGLGMLVGKHRGRH